MPTVRYPRLKPMGLSFHLCTRVLAAEDIRPSDNPACAEDFLSARASPLTREPSLP